MLTALPAPQRAVVRALQGLLLVGGLVFLGSTVLRPSPELSPLLDGWLANSLYALAGALCLARARLVGRERVAWACMGVGLELFMLGNTYWFFMVRTLDPQPYPSLADALYLGFYPLAYVAMTLLVRQRIQRFSTAVWLDGIVGGLGSAAICAAVAFQTIVDATGGSVAAVATNLTYPVGDLLLFVLVMGVFALLGWRPDPMWLLLGVGLILFAVGDTAYLFRVAANTYHVGTPLDGLWAVGQTAMAFAAWQTPGDDRPRRMEGWTMLIVPSLFALSSIGVLVLGNFRQVSVLAVGLATGTLFAVVVRTAVTFREVRALTESRRQARTDELTGLGNRRLLYARLESALAERSEEAVVALLVIDLDRFKEVNDALGHHVGDQLLCQIGPRLAPQLGPGDTLARLGGDEFAVVLASTDQPGAAAAAQRLLGAFEAPFDLDGVTLHIDVSIGLALCPDHAADATALLKRADLAMYQAKAARSGWRLYAFERHEPGLDRLQTIEDLRSAVTEGQLVLHYQPKIAPRTGAVVGVEALVRWAHPHQGLLYPDTFLPLAERANLMRSLTLVVLQSALRQCQRWRQDGLDLPVAVNLSAANLLDVQLPGDVAKLLAALGLPPRALELEITETTLMADPVRGKQVLGELRTLGVRIAVDDYGTGYSSLAYLQELAVDELKLDKSFVMRMIEDAGAGAIVRTTVDLAHSLGLTLVAEGVEDAAALAELERLGCDVAQGYHISKPLPGPQATAWLWDRIGRQPSRQPEALSANPARTLPSQLADPNV
jgi:diguanylate cyclase (GGDEF)-like protein